ncbi:MAG TPA: putative LPS assembly protein LptD [Tenuifilaceae bacterium]|nr:putative LPS assembly protein LptD [Tenuifilaceae bacterium]HPN21748.1 putative LPS assembly protein LptD [Tenuifilaceae bacterium]
MHFRLLFFLIIINHAVGFANSGVFLSSIIKPTYQLADTVTIKDTVQNKAKESPIDNPIFTNAEDSIIYSIDGKTAFLYGNAIVTYQNLELKANYIEFDMEKKQVFARGAPDSTGKIVGRPTFKEGSQSFEMDSIHYNFDTKRAKITGVVTEQSGGYMHSEVTKKMEDDVVNMMHGKYTTCDAPHPHFYLAITKGKMIPDKKIISGPAYLVIEDVPFPLIIPFGFFPNTRKRAAGLILPEYGEENNRGLFLRGGGFYFGMGDYMDEKITGDFFSRGSWGLRSQTNYKVRYKFSGSLNLEASTIVTSEKGLADYAKSNSYWIRWNHSQDQKAHPNSTFQASVNFGSSNHNRYNATSLNTALSNQFNSSISFSKVWPGTPFSLSTSLNHSQNNLDSIVNLGFPKVSFSMTRIYPFKRKNSVGSSSWYEKIGVSLSSSLDNRVSVKENNLFKPSVLDSMQNGMKHDIPVSTSFNLLKYVTVSPGVNYSEYWYLKTINKSWDADSNVVVVDTVNGFQRGYQYSSSVSMSTKVYGTFTFSKTSKVQAVRHVITPSVSLSYRPDFSESQFGFYKQVQKDSLGNMEKYSIFSQGIYGGPGGGKSGVLNFSLNNILEMKILTPKDTANSVKKVKILEGLSINASYNLLADSMNWSDISVSGRTSLFDKININFSGGFSPYALNSTGTKIAQFEYDKSGKLARFIRGNVGFDFSLNSTKAGANSGNPGVGDETGSSAGLPLGSSPDGSNFGESMGTQYGMNYVDFNVPWNLRFSYNLTYSKPQYESSVVQTLSFSGDINLTPKWKIGFSSGYDFKNKQLTTTSINFFRDLHCWDMRMTVIPIGFYKSFSFQINVKSAILQDLKYTKRDHYLDNL